MRCLYVLWKLWSGKFFWFSPKFSTFSFPPKEAIRLWNLLFVTWAEIKSWPEFSCQINCQSIALMINWWGQCSGISVYLEEMRQYSRMFSSWLGSKMGWLIALTLYLCAFAAFGQDFVVSKRCLANNYSFLTEWAWYTVVLWFSHRYSQVTLLVSHFYLSLIFTS